LLELTPARPELVHCHNLHGDYFDLRCLPWLSSTLPVVLTLHDAWLLSGHCGHSFDCERWKIGCGQCPDLTIYPPIRRDATAENWRRKQRVYADSRLYVATPCRWLIDKALQSIVAPAIAESRVIPYGVDQSVFSPGDRAAARAMLGIPSKATMVLFVANGIRYNRWKDFALMKHALRLLAERVRDRPLLWFGLGERASAEQVGSTRLIFVPFQSDPARVAQYYRAADLYVHAARADTFPNAILEALACGVPVVATAVGGIPEQVNGLRDAAGSEPSAGSMWNRYDDDLATGLLSSPADVVGLANGLTRLVVDRPLRLTLGANAADDARRRFDLQREVTDYLAWYEEILAAQPAAVTVGA